MKKKSAQEKVMLQRLRSVRYIASRSACIRKGLPDIHSWRRAVFVGIGYFLNGLADLPGACIDVRCRALNDCDGLIELQWEVTRLNVCDQSIGVVVRSPKFALACWTLVILLR